MYKLLIFFILVNIALTKHCYSNRRIGEVKKCYYDAMEEYINILRDARNFYTNRTWSYNSNGLYRRITNSKMDTTNKYLKYLDYWSTSHLIYVYLNTFYYDLISESLFPQVYKPQYEHFHTLKGNTMLMDYIDEKVCSKGICLN